MKTTLLTIFLALLVAAPAQSKTIPASPDSAAFYGRLDTAMLNLSHTDVKGQANQNLAKLDFFTGQHGTSQALVHMNLNDSKLLQLITGMINRYCQASGSSSNSWASVLCYKKETSTKSVPEPGTLLLLGTGLLLLVGLKRRRPVITSA